MQIEKKEVALALLSNPELMFHLKHAYGTIPPDDPSYIALKIKDYVDVVYDALNS